MIQNAIYKSFQIVAMQKYPKFMLRNKYNTKKVILNFILWSHTFVYFNFYFIHLVVKHPVHMHQKLMSMTFKLLAHNRDRFDLP